MSKVHVRLSLCVEYDGDRIDEGTALDNLFALVESATDSFPEALESVDVFGHEVIS
jgi:hypothetical protein